MSAASDDLRAAVAATLGEQVAAMTVVR
ncbi:MAG: hypothetical protein JWM12_2275, partial [Ilumatobacteraceae bacterium]|nr:hypothetical protein [Ilumatobacteraceae bacterium]